MCSLQDKQIVDGAGGPPWGNVQGMPVQVIHNPESVTAIADRLKRTRQAQRLEQAAWCRLVGIEPQAWNNYERGIRRISLDQAIKVCRATGVSLDWIYRGIASGLPVNLATALQSSERPPRKRS